MTPPTAAPAIVPPDVLWWGVSREGFGEVPATLADSELCAVGDEGIPADTEPTLLEPMWSHVLCVLWEGDPVSVAPVVI